MRCRSWCVGWLVLPGLACGMARPEPNPGSRAATFPAAAQPPPAVFTPRAGPWSLADLLAQARASQPDLLRVRARIQEADAQVREARAAWLPVLGLSQGYAITDNPAQSFAMLLDQHRLQLGPGFDPTPGATQNWRTEARVDVPLYTPGRGAQIEAAETAALAFQYEALAAEQELMAAVTLGWYGLRTAHDLAEVTEGSVAVVAQRLAQTEVRLQAGAALPADVLRLQARLATARADAAAARLAHASAASALAVLAGLPPEPALSIDRDEAPPAVPAPDRLAEALQQARERRQDLRAAERRVHVLEEQRNAAAAAWLPSLQAFGAYHIDGRDPTFDLDLDSWGAGVELRFILSANTSPRIDAAAARLEQGRRALRAVELTVGRQVTDAFHAIAAAEETKTQAVVGRAAAEEAWRILSAAHDAGGATTTDVLEAEDARRQAQVRQVAASAGADMARVRLLAAMGDLR